MAFYYACIDGDIDTILSLIKKGSKFDWNCGIEYACFGVRNIDGFLKDKPHSAQSPKHTNIVLLMIEKGADIKNLYGSYRIEYYKRFVKQLNINDCASIVCEYLCDYLSVNMWG